MDRADVVNDFHALDVSDSLLKAVELRTGEAECRLTFSAVRRIAPRTSFERASMRFFGVRSIAFDGPYQLNSTVVGNGAAPLAPSGDLVEFHFELTGGTDPEAFMVKLTIAAKGFVFEEARDGSAA